MFVPFCSDGVVTSFSKECLGFVYVFFSNRRNNLEGFVDNTQDKRSACEHTGHCFISTCCRGEIEKLSLRRELTIFSEGAKEGLLPHLIFMFHPVKLKKY